MSASNSDDGEFRKEPSDSDRIASKWKTTLELFVAFLTIGAITFGGGMGMLINLQREISDKRKWLSYDELMDYVAIAQCTPGVIMVNTATLLGAKKAGFIGSAVATIAVVLPSIVIITGIAMLMSSISGIEHYMSKFMIGMRIAVCAIGIRTILKLMRSYVTGLKSVLLFVLFFIIGFFPIFFGNTAFYADMVGRYPFLGFIFSNASSVLILLGILLGILMWNTGKAAEARHQDQKGGS